MPFISELREKLEEAELTMPSGTIRIRGDHSALEIKSVEYPSGLGFRFSVVIRPFDNASLERLGKAMLSIDHGEERETKRFFIDIEKGTARCDLAALKRGERVSLRLLAR